MIRRWLGPVVLCAAVGGLLALPAAVAAQGLPGVGDGVHARAVAHTSTVSPGDQLMIAVELQHDEGYHTWPHEPVVPVEFGADFPAIATTIDLVSVPDGTEAHPIQWPDPVTVTVYYTLEPVDMQAYAGTVVAYVPLTLPAELPPGNVTVELRVGWQACDETTCWPPEEKTLEVPVTVAAVGAAASAVPNEPELFARCDMTGFAGAEGGAAAEPITMSAFGREFSFDPTGVAGLALLLMLAALGGLLLNVTPCVLPVIPLKIMSLSKAAGSPRRLLVLGVMMSLGVIAFWLALGGAIAFVSGFSAISSLFQTGWFSAIVGIVVAVMAIGMFGVFEVRLPQAVYRVRPEQESPQGSFLFGILTAVLSTPCTAPFMGAAAAWAATQAPAITMATFTAIGAGMALPYLLLSFRPDLVSRVPRSGPASVLVKQTMGFFMLAVASFFLGLWLSSTLAEPPDPASSLYWWAVAFWIVVGCAWVVFQSIKIVASRSKRAAVIAVSALVALAAVVLARDFASGGPIEWTYYTPERFAQATAAGDVVVLDFTAEWCLNCRALEDGVLHTQQIVDLLHTPGVVPMRVDLTCDNPDGKAKLAELKWVGIPLLAVFGPATGYDKPALFDSYTPQVVLDAVNAARGAAASGGG